MTDATDPMADLGHRLKPYRDQFPSFRELPTDGLARTEVTGLVERLASAEEHMWRDGYASGAVYHGDPEHVAFLGSIYTAQSQSNPLHPGLQPACDIAALVGIAGPRLADRAGVSDARDGAA